MQISNTRKQINYPKSNIHKSTPLLSSSDRIIKLIYNKKYPLNIAKKQQPILPKIKSTYKQTSALSGPKPKKKYVQIDISDNQNNFFEPVPQEQLWYKYAIQSTAFQNQQSQYLQMIKKLQNNNSQSQTIQKLTSTFHDRLTSSSLQDPQNNKTKEYTNILTQQSQKNSTFLNRIRNSINYKKLKYLQHAKYSELFEEQHQKENCSFEYIANKIDQKNQKDFSLFKKSPYSSLFSNRIKDYIQIFILQKSNQRTCEQDQKYKEINLPICKHKNINNSAIDKQLTFITSSLPFTNQKSSTEHRKQKHNKEQEI